MKKLLFFVLLMVVFCSTTFAADGEDKFPPNQYSPKLEAPAYNMFAITPSDTDPIAFTTRAITCAVDGNLVVQTISGETVTIGGRVAGIDYPYRVTHVYNTTTMTGCVGLY